MNHKLRPCLIKEVSRNCVGCWFWCGVFRISHRPFFGLIVKNLKISGIVKNGVLKSVNILWCLKVKDWSDYKGINWYQGVVYVRFGIPAKNRKAPGGRTGPVFLPVQSGTFNPPGFLITSPLHRASRLIFLS